MTGGYFYHYFYCYGMQILPLLALEFLSQNTNMRMHIRTYVHIHTYIHLYHSNYGNSDVIKMIISLLNFLGIRYHPCTAFFLKTSSRYVL